MNYKGLIAKGTIASMLALSIGTGSAWADEAGTQPTVTSDAAATTSTTSATSTTETEQKTPSLLPGDFFYFVKMVYERIQLEYASNDMEEAILLAQFAQERLAEMAVLLEEGSFEAAEEAFLLSLSQQQQAIETAASFTDPATTETTVEGDATETAAEEGALQEEDQAGSEAEEGVEPVQADNVKNSLQHNIVALTAALEKVKNPQAQSSLLKNITKSFAKLEKKLTKLSEKKEVAATAPVSQETAASTDGYAESTETIETAETAVDDNDNEYVKPGQEKKQSPKKAEKQPNKPAKSQGNAGKSESAGSKKEAK
ncbi:DUF5667 domain-containing protein [Paenibacillus sp. PAMC21692]|uniref:DUF5667 domain-containing protein n=1 Tax=Paenibacillus sp. PAMC21692 TaxID=2762320 RepID=UPI00164E0D78|nr:DUF5667 domain-containing protein [Paenibacillus sp. PAMC21692]QNK58547.1 hypothetical protein H7F31_06470 [Paenibacillus sp. PAMC21692]